MKRCTYPYITRQKHPLATGRQVARSLKNGMREPDIEDMRLAEHILAIHAQIKESTADGEWKWINDNKRKNYLALLEKGNAAALARCLANMFRNDATFGIITSHIEALKTKADLRALENDILSDLDAFAEFDGDPEKTKWLSRYERCGNMYGFLTHHKTVISADAPRHRHYANKITTLLRDAHIQKPTIVEIGGGYGGLCLDVILRSKGGRYINCDLPETLYLCYYFLKKALPAHVSIGWAIESMPNTDIVLVPAHKKQLIKKADIVFNANSLSEMGQRTVNEYFRLIHKLRPLYFMHQNSNFLLFPNSPRHIEVLASDFPIKESLYKKMYMALTPWQGASGRYREYLYQRISS